MSDRRLTILVTGGAGFIGSALVRRLMRETEHVVVNVDKLTYAGNLESLAAAENAPNYRFERVDICDGSEVRRVFAAYQPDAVMHLAAESHVDRSIDGPTPFVETNVVGTYTLLEAARAHCAARHGGSVCEASRPLEAGGFRFLHVSTDEVFGTLESKGRFGPQSRYQPNSPYAASKASADHLVRAWGKTFGLPVVMTNCSNNYGPYQFPEKLIPLVILHALADNSIPVYGDGQQVRDWLYVEDHVSALWKVLCEGEPGEVYCIGGDAEHTNLAVVESIVDLLDEVVPRKGKRPRRKLITFAEDRPGHDRRYAMDIEPIKESLAWTPSESFASGLRMTVQWYLDNPEWCRRVQDGSYRGERLGLVQRASANG